MHIPGFQIERLTGFDAADAVDLGELRHHESPWKPNEPFAEAMTLEMIDPARQTIIAAREVETGFIRSTEALGFVTMGDAGTFNIGRLGVLGCVSTNPGFRKRGLYRAVWREGLDWLVENSVSSVLFNSNPNLDEREIARKLYVRYGAKIISRATKEGETDFFRLDIQEALNTWAQLHPEA